MRLITYLAATTLLTACNVGPEYAAKSAIEATLNDPVSVQYRDVKSYSEDVVCGEYNAKNAMGGYVGFTKFITRNGQLVSDDIEINGIQLCNDKTGKVEVRTVALPVFKVKFATDEALNARILVHVAKGSESLTSDAEQIIKSESAAQLAKLAPAQWDELIKQIAVGDEIAARVNKQVWNGNKEVGIQGMYIGISKY